MKYVYKAYVRCDKCAVPADIILNNTDTFREQMPAGWISLAETNSQLKDSHGQVIVSELCPVCSNISLKNLWAWVKRVK